MLAWYSIDAFHAVLGRDVLSCTVFAVYFDLHSAALPEWICYSNLEGKNTDFTGGTSFDTADNAAAGSGEQKCQLTCIDSCLEYTVV